QHAAAAFVPLSEDVGINVDRHAEACATRWYTALVRKGGRKRTMQRTLPVLLSVLAAAAGVIATTFLSAQTAPATNPRAVLDTYCVTCHNQKLLTAGLALDTADVTRPGANPETWEKV